MSRELRQRQAQETVAACEAGFYITAGGKRVEISRMIAEAKKGTILYSAQSVPQSSASPATSNATFEVRNETTFSAVRSLAGEGGHVACLNFASARHPGGGFLGGARAQEEALARASALYPCLLMAPDYYERNRMNRSALYLDLAIWSPSVPFIRDDDGEFLEQPVLASVITAPAPNAGALAENEPRSLPLVEAALRSRAELVLQIARAHQVERLVLGAWGCGVFRNDPVLVASVFLALLKRGAAFGSTFSKVVFAVLDRTENQHSLKAFTQAFQGEMS